MAANEQDRYDMTGHTKDNASAIAKPIWLLATTLVIEAILSVSELSRTPGVMSLTKVVGDVFPAVTNFMLAPSASPNVAPYLALTILLMPVKVYFAYRILLRFSRTELGNLATLPSSNSSLARRLMSSLFVIVLSVGFFYAVFFTSGNEYFTSQEALRSAAAKYRLILTGGIWMWVSWSILELMVVVFLLGLLFVFVVEWWKISLKRR